MPPAGRRRPLRPVAPGDDGPVSQPIAPRGDPRRWFRRTLRRPAARRTRRCASRWWTGATITCSSRCCTRWRRPRSIRPTSPRRSAPCSASRRTPRCCWRRPVPSGRGQLAGCHLDRRCATSTYDYLIVGDRSAPLLLRSRRVGDAGARAQESRATRSRSAAACCWRSSVAERETRPRAPPRLSHVRRRRRRADRRGDGGRGRRDPALCACAGTSAISTAARRPSCCSRAGPVSCPPTRPS